MTLKPVMQFLETQLTRTFQNNNWNINNQETLDQKAFFLIEIFRCLWSCNLNHVLLDPPIAKNQTNGCKQKWCNSLCWTLTMSGFHPQSPSPLRPQTRTRMSPPPSPPPHPPRYLGRLVPVDKVLGGGSHRTGAAPPPHWFRGPTEEEEQDDEVVQEGEEEEEEEEEEKEEDTAGGRRPPGESSRCTQSPLWTLAPSSSSS